MKILITGINGFIGQHLAFHLMNSGHQVVGLGRNESCAVQGVYYIQGDVLNRADIKRAITGVETVIHLAGLTAHKDIVDNKYRALEVNFLGTKNVLDEFTLSTTARKFICSSSGKVYGDIKSLPLSEEHPTKPLNILGKFKLITEHLINFYATPGKSFVIFRIFNVYGQWQKENFLVPTIQSQLERGDSVVLGDVTAQRDYTYVDDVAKAFGLAVQADLPSGVLTFNICSNKGTTAKEMVEIIAKLKGRDIFLTSRDSLVRTDEAPIEYGSFDKIKKFLQWKPQYSLEEGLKKTIE